MHEWECEANMATLTRMLHISKITVNNVSKLFSNLHIAPSVKFITNPVHVQRIPLMQCASIHTTIRNNGLMEFFDEEENWSKDRIRVGRSWKVHELRVKSNEDLHKLWFVLLKERNMLYTMEEIYKNGNIAFPNPERIDKVTTSMENIEKVVRERNEAYFMLETGVGGERPKKYVYSPIGLRVWHKKSQYTIPKHLNAEWNKTHKFGFTSGAVRKFLKLYREKLWNEKRKEISRQYNQAMSTLRIFPNTNLEALAKKYPLVNIKKILNSDKTCGHAVPK